MKLTGTNRSIGLIILIRQCSPFINRARCPIDEEVDLSSASVASADIRRLGYAPKGAPFRSKRGCPRDTRLRRTLGRRGCLKGWAREAREKADAEISFICKQTSASETRRVHRRRITMVGKQAAVRAHRVSDPWRGQPQADRPSDRRVRKPSRWMSAPATEAKIKDHLLDSYLRLADLVVLAGRPHPIPFRTRP